MKTKKKSLRRHQKQRLKNRAKRILKEHWGFDQDYQPTDKEIGKFYKTPKNCSCWMCCNERRRKKFFLNIVETDDEERIHRIRKKRTVSKKDILTKQELKNKEDFEEQLMELKERGIA